MAENRSDYPHGLLRLHPDVSGSGPDKGRLEVFKFGRWGQVCHTSFDGNAASVACRELGYVNVESVKEV